jgi:DinB superfamily
MTERRLRELFIGWFDHYAARTTERLEGLTDDEYLWEPVANCWNVRASAGGPVADWAWPPPEPAPVTTIAWRLVHVCSMLSEHGLRAVAFEAGKANHVRPSQVPACAADATVVWDRSVVRWKRDLATVTEERLWQPMGPEAGPFADDPVASFIEHVHDEFIHHTAEIALLRDLSRCRIADDG